VTAPGTIIREQTTQASRAPDVDTGQFFLALPAPQGPTTPTLIRGMTDWVAAFGPRDPTTGAYDAADGFFRVGGKRLWFNRVVSSTSVPAQITLKDASNADTLRITLRGQGVWGNTLSVQVIAGISLNTIQVKLLSGSTVLEQTPDLASSQEYVDWASRFSLFASGAALLGTLPKVAAAAPFAAGSEGGSVADADYATALAHFSPSYGPGQVACSGRITAAILQAVVDHAASNRRVGFLDSVLSTSASAVVASVAGLAGANAIRSASFNGPVLFPGLTGVNSTRQIPASALAAGRVAALDGINAGYAVGAAGVPEGILDGAVGLAQDWQLAADLDTLYSAPSGAVNPVISRRSGIQIYGWKTLANPSSQANYIGLGVARTLMAAEWLFDVAAEPYVHDRITRAHITEFGQKLASICSQLYKQGDLYSRDGTENDAYYVNVAEPINTAQTAQARQINAEVGLKIAETADYIVITVIKSALTEVFA
jgi:hypothetical protein